MNTIFFGAGRYAIDNIEKWIDKGIIPSCFCDSDTEKQGNLFTLETWGKDKQIPIYSLTYAIEKYKDYVIYPTVAPINIESVVDYLRDYGIPEENVRYLYKLDKKISCQFLGRHMTYYPDYFATCCFQQRVRFDFGDNFEAEYKIYKKRCDEIVDGLNRGINTPCTGCPKLEKKIWTEDDDTLYIDFGTGFNGDLCNFNCCYCNMNGYLTNIENQNPKKIIDYLNEIKKANVAPKIILGLAAGEPTLRSDFTQILECAENNNWHIAIATNGSVHNSKLLDMIDEGYVDNILVSMDAGTKETFELVKGSTLFDKVKSNIIEFSRKGVSLLLKYILLEEKNDSKKDIVSFVEFAELTNAHILLSHDAYMINERLSEKSVKTFEMFMYECYKRNITYSYEHDSFNEADYCCLSEIDQRIRAK